MSLRDDLQWSTIRQYLRAEPYDRDTNQAGEVRHRIEVVMPDDMLTRQWLLALTTNCARVECGKPIHPIRGRKTWGTWYFSASCAKDVVCRNNKGTTAEYRAIVQDLLGHPPPSTLLPLFD